MTYDVLATKWNNHFGSSMCPCRCYDKPPYISEYSITIKTKTIEYYGDPLVEFVQVWCRECDSRSRYEIDDGYSRTSKYKI